MFMGKSTIFGNFLELFVMFTGGLPGEPRMDSAWPPVSLPWRVSAAGPPPWRFRTGRGRRTWDTTCFWPAPAARLGQRAGEKREKLTGA